MPKFLKKNIHGRCEKSLDLFVPCVSVRLDRSYETSVFVCFFAYILVESILLYYVILCHLNETFVALNLEFICEQLKYARNFFDCLCMDAISCESELIVFVAAAEEVV